MSVIDKLNTVTYVVEHNPNCPSPFLVRLIRKGVGVIDFKSPSLTKDVLGYGKTLKEAAQEAFNKKDQIN